MTTHQPSVLDSGYSWFRLLVSLVISIVGSAGMWVVILVLPRVQAEFNVSRSEVSLGYTALMVGFALGNLFLGRLIDRFGVTWVIVFAAVCLTIGLSLAGHATLMMQVALAQGLLVGVGAAACFGPMMADVSHWFHRWRGVAVGVTASGNYMAGALWPILLRPVLDADGWRGAYITTGIACAVIMIPLAFVLRRPAPHRNATARAADVPPTLSIDIPPRALIALLAIAGIGCCVAMAMPQVHIVAYCLDLGYGPAVGAEMLSLMLFGGIVSRLASGVLADRIGGVRTLLLGSALQCLALFLYLPFDGLVSLYVVSLVFGLSQGGIVPSYAIIIREYLPARVAGERVGLVLMVTIAGMALGGWMSGLIFDLTGSYHVAFWNGIAFNFLNIAIMVFILWRASASRLATA